MKELDKVVNFLKINSNVKVEIGVHTDTRGTYEGDTRITKKRAGRLAEYIIKEGIDSRRIITTGYGKYYPIIINAKNEKEHLINRRTELKIIYP